MSVVDRYIRAVWNAWVFPLSHRRVLAIVHTHDNAPCGTATATITVLADLVTHNAATDGANNRSRRAAVALSDRATQHATRHGTDHRAQSAAVAIAAALHIHLIDLLDDTAVLAARGVCRTRLIAAVLRRRTACQSITRRHDQRHGKLE